MFGKLQLDDFSSEIRCAASDRLMGLTSSAESIEVPAYTNATCDVKHFAQYVGTYKTPNGSLGYLTLRDGKFSFDAKGKFIWKSELVWKSHSDGKTVFQVPGHPLSQQNSGGIVFVHDSKTGNISEFAGGDLKKHGSVWVVEKLESGKKSSPTDITLVAVFAEEESGKPRQSAHIVTEDAAIKSVKERVLEMQKDIESAQETLIMLQQQTVAKPGGAPKEGTRRLPHKDLSRMTADQLHAELEEATTLHGQLKDQIDILQAAASRPSRASFILAKRVQGFSPDELLGSQSEYGLVWDRTWEKFAADPLEHREQRRDEVRYGTRKKVALELRLRSFGEPAGNAGMYPPYSNSTMLFLDESPDSRVGDALASTTNLLGRYDVVVVRARPDYDRDWNLLPPEKKFGFFVAHAAAINIGESIRAADFFDYSREGKLDKDGYVRAMGHVLLNVVKACNNIRVEHFVFFPFGLGAFIRHVSLLDPALSEEMEMQELRRAVCQIFVKVLANLHPDCHIHLCISFSEGEPKMNADAFLRAFSSASGDIKRRTTIWPNGDSLQVAADLASRSKFVLLVNGANRRLLGNHWFGKHAKRAIDENLHRRSWTLSALSYMLNNFGGAEEGRDLSTRVRLIGGSVQPIDARS